MSVPQTACGVAWAVCPDCLGQPLVTSAGASRCVRCRSSWPTVDVEPCPWPATELLIDHTAHLRVCASHAIAWKPAPLPSLEEGRDV
jgi:hypothetical protein